MIEIPVRRQQRNIQDSIDLNVVSLVQQMAAVVGIYNIEVIRDDRAGQCVGCVRTPNEFGNYEIRYNRGFVNKLLKYGWNAVKGFIAHELGHIILKHLNPNDSWYKNFQDENEADYFAAMLLANLGISLDQTLSMFRADDFDRSSPDDVHSDEFDRMESFKKGWYDAHGIPYSKQPNPNNHYKSQNSNNIGSVLATVGIIGAVVGVAALAVYGISQVAKRVV